MRASTTSGCLGIARSVGRHLNRSSFKVRAAAFAAVVAPLAAVGANAAPAALTVELNKLETEGTGCRAYVVVTNDAAVQYQTLKVELILFQPDGVIGRRFSIDLGPLKASKRTVKLFDLDNIACDKIGSFLLNDVVECKSDTGPLDDCLSGMTVKSLTNVEFAK